MAAPAGSCSSASGSPGRFFSAGGYGRRAAFSPPPRLGLIIGGALSNVVDRVRHGAVADFFLFHVGNFEWYVFNLADVWIVAGVAGLVLSWAMERPEKAKTA